MANIPFITDNARNRIPVNWFPAKDSEFGIIMWGTPGLTEKYAGQNQVRGMAPCRGWIYGVSGNQAWRMDNQWVVQTLGEMAGDSGPVNIVDNGDEVLFQEDGYVYLHDTSFHQVTAAPDASSATYQDGYFIVSEKNTNKFYISGLYDGDSWDSLDFASCEGSPDKIIATRSAHRELWHFNERTTEVWYNSGDADFPFAKLNGANIEVGCRAEASVRLCNSSFVWLTNRLQIVKNTGYQPQIISTRKLDREIEALTRTDDAWAYSYIQDGHEFYVINFPTDRKTWAWDAETGLWHQRESQGCMGRHRVSCATYLGGLHIAGDFENGRIYEMSTDVYTEPDHEIIRTMETQATQNTAKEGKLLRFANLKIKFKSAGIVPEGGQGSDPQAMLQWSDDGGNTWGNEHWADIGLVGKYKHRCKWNRLGSSRDRVWRLMLSDPVDPTILTAILETA